MEGGMTETSRLDLDDSKESGVDREVKKEEPEEEPIESKPTAAELAIYNESVGDGDAMNDEVKEEIIDQPIARESEPAVKRVKTEDAEVPPVPTDSINTVSPPTVTKQEAAPTIVHNTPKAAVNQEEAGPGIVYIHGDYSEDFEAAGYGVWWGDNDVRNAKGSVDDSYLKTSVRAEIKAAVSAIDTAKAGRVSDLTIRTESEWLVNAVNVFMNRWRTNGWRRVDGDPVKHQDLLKYIDSCRSQMHIFFELVPYESRHQGTLKTRQLASRACHKACRRAPFRVYSNPFCQCCP